MKYGIVHGAVEWDEPNDIRKRRRLMPNPFPEDIYALVTATVTIPGVAFSLYRLIKLWIEHQNAKQIKIKNGDIEVEIKGGVNARDIQKVLSLFRKAAKINEDSKVKVVIPKGCKPDLPKLSTKVKQK